MRDLFDRELFTVEVALHELLVGFDDGVEQLRVVLADLRLQLCGDLGRFALALALRARVRAHVQEVDDAGQLVLRTDRQMNRDAMLGELFLQRAEDAEEVRALAVEHVHKEHAREVAVGRALPVARCLHLDAHDPADNEEGTLDDADRGHRVTDEAGVARRVDQIDLAVMPLQMADRRGERHLSSLLVLVPVGDCGAGLDRAEPVRRAGLKEHRFDERRLSGTAVSDDGDVANLPRLVGHASSCSLAWFPG